MTRPQIIEGTTEEIAALLQEGALAGRKLRLIIDPDEEDYSDSLPAPPNAVCDQAQLEELLLEGLASPKEELTDKEWSELRREVRERLARRKK